MTDIITKARKEWCTDSVGTVGPLVIKAPAKPCPPEVVAALLDVLKGVHKLPQCPVCLCHFREIGHIARCPVAIAEAVITRELEGK